MIWIGMLIIIVMLVEIGMKIELLIDIVKDHLED